MDYAKWIKEARSSWGKTQEQLAQALGVTKGNVSAWEHGRHKPRLEQVYAIARITGAELPPEVTNIVPTYPTGEEGLSVMLLGNTASMGVGEDVAEYDVMRGTITLTPQFVAEHLHPTNPGSLRFIHAHGSSMEPTFSSGDILLVDTGVREVKGNGVYVLSAHGRLFVKRVVEKIDGSFVVSSDNPTHKTVETLAGENQIHILGKVLWAWNGHNVR